MVYQHDQRRNEGEEEEATKTKTMHRIIVVMRFIISFEEKVLAPTTCSLSHHISHCFPACKV